MRTRGDHYKWRFLSGHIYDRTSSIMLSSKWRGRYRRGARVGKKQLKWGEKTNLRIVSPQWPQTLVRVLAKVLAEIMVCGFTNPGWLSLVLQQTAVPSELKTPWHRNTGKHIDGGCAFVFLNVIWEIIDIKTINEIG